MRMHEHDNQPIEQPAASGAAPTGGGNLHSFRTAGEAFLKAADGAIKKGLSGNSLQFNQAVEQEEGQ